MCSCLYFQLPLAYRWKPDSKGYWRGTKHMLGSVYQWLDSWVSRSTSLLRHCPSSVGKSPPSLSVACLDWERGLGVGIEDISLARGGSCPRPSSPSSSEDLASGGLGFPTSHILLCCNALLQTFPASIWFHPPFTPLRFPLVWDASVKPLIFHSDCEFSFQELYLFSIISTDLGRAMSPQCLLSCPLDPVIGN